MGRGRPLCFAAIMLVGWGAESKAAPPDPTPQGIRSSIERSLVLIQKSMSEYPQHRECFSCHHQAVPALAVSLCREKGLRVDEECFQEQLILTEEDLKGAADSYRKGEGQPGGVTRAGYALWTLETGGHRPDETTAAVVSFLLTRDADRAHWRTSSNRPPSEVSPFTATYFALRGLKSFGDAGQKDRIDERFRKARDWLVGATAEATEDRVFRLWSLKLAEAPKEVIQQAANQLREGQRDDGGWGQTPDRPSDAYATGSALVALHLGADLPCSDPLYQKGLSYLMQTQKDDGSWHVVSRSKPFQPYFESGFPYGKDQFISMSATAWATSALALSCPRE
jgi:hypothetical protein